MGKKVKILATDPILSRNYKYEKRIKERLEERAKNEEERAVQLKRKKQMVEISSKVDSQIEQVSANLSLLAKTTKIAKLKSQMLKKTTKDEGQPSKSVAKVPELQFSTVAQKTDSYSYHFQLKIEQSEISEEKKQTKTQQIEEETRNQIRKMFGTEGTQQQKQQEMQIERKDEIYNLAIECKKQSEIRIDNEPFFVTENFVKNQSILSKPPKGSDPSLAVAKELIDNYFDHVYIENSQEEKIQNFRRIVLDHSIAHLDKSLEEEKGRGFTNCKILILTPFIGDARAIIELIEQKYPQYEANNKEKMEQLEDENDFFRIGIKVVKKKKQLNYFSNFDHSQIIVASPVGLKSIIGAEGDQKRENSFISSVEVLYVDRASTLLMQNWTHLVEVLQNMNFMPNYESLKNSIDLIRDSFLELKGRLYRQSIVFSEFNCPELNALKRFHFHNVQGCATSKMFYKKSEASSPYDQQFFKIEVREPKDDLQIRFQYFKRKFWDDLHNKESLTKVVLLTNSYFEYVKLKTFLERVNASAQYICEHTSKNKVQSRIAKFNRDQFRILLMTERSFYFEICQIKKFHSIYFYSLPKNNFIYEELLSNMVPDENNTNRIINIYTKYDRLILERIVGTTKAIQMVKQYCNNVSFVI